MSFHQSNGFANLLNELQKRGILVFEPGSNVVTERAPIEKHWLFGPQGEWFDRVKPQSLVGKRQVRTNGSGNLPFHCIAAVSEPGDGAIIE